MSNPSWVMDATKKFMRLEEGNCSLLILRRKIHSYEFIIKADVVIDDSMKAEPLFYLHS